MVVLDVKETIAGGVGAICCAYSGNPFDVAKVRLQTQLLGSPDFYKGPIDCLLKIVRSEGVLALWKGVTPSLTSAMIENSVVFSANGILKRIYLSYLKEDQTPSLSLFESACLGGGAAFFSASVSHRVIFYYFVYIILFIRRQ
jgi:hypothetical protein